MIEFNSGKSQTVYAAANGNTEIVHSDDKGIHGSAPTVVAAKANDMCMDAPDIILLHDNSVLVCYNPRPSKKKS